jgi:hypothetical protein
MAQNRVIDGAHNRATNDNTMTADTILNRFPDIKILGMSGAARSGKDYLTEQYILEYGFLQMALADHFKINVAAKGVLSTGEAFDVDVLQLWETDKDDTHRQVLQEEGTERGRIPYGENIWVRHLELWIYKHALRGLRRFVVTDVRFVNEVEAIQNWGGKVIRVVGRGGLQGATNQHPSETALDAFTGFDKVIDNAQGREAKVGWEVKNALAEFGFI